MTKEKIKYIPLYFMKLPPKTGYHIGHTADVPEEKAKSYIKKGYAREATKVLPNDLPGREALMGAGYETLDEVKKAKDLTKVEGIGEATAKQIADYFKDS